MWKHLIKTISLIRLGYGRRFYTETGVKPVKILTTLVVFHVQSCVFIELIANAVLPTVQVNLYHASRSCLSCLHRCCSVTKMHKKHTRIRKTADREKYTGTQSCKESMLTMPVSALIVVLSQWKSVRTRLLEPVSKAPPARPASARSSGRIVDTS